MGKWEEAAKTVDEQQMKYCEDKLMYFFKRQLEINNSDQDDHPNTNWRKDYL
jgi:hypothetical protein